jgi:DNA-binding CsgD family transcriptional regulator
MLNWGPKICQPTTEDSMNNLTRLERKIAILMAQGLTNKEIAQRLGSSPFTVRNQVKLIFYKLELQNRIQVAFLVGQHLIDDEIATYLNGNHAQIRGQIKSLTLY